MAESIVNPDLINSFERIPVNIFPRSEEGSQHVARHIAKLITTKEKQGKPCILGLATGSTPIPLYAELIRLHQEEGLSFKNVITFNLDEYYPMTADDVNSYHYFMQQQLFDHIDIKPENTHVPDGNIPKEDLKESYKAYEKAIQEAGGIDLQILGIGQNGHIGFNEPGSSKHSTTRLVPLENHTRLANAPHFDRLIDVPRMAVTTGIKTIMQAKEVILLAWGENKADAILNAVEKHQTEMVPASLLQNHSNCTFVIDEQAAQKLTRTTKPWLTGAIQWDEKLIWKAVCSLALELDKPILMLTDEDYHDHGLSDLIDEHGSSYDINLDVFNGMKRTITGWPGGKPNVEILGHPERPTPASKRVLIFSPHPDDDIISMGGTFIRLHEQGHDVHVAYQTSGNIAVGDDFVERFLDFAVGYDKLFDVKNTPSSKILQEARAFFKDKKKGEPDKQDIREIKGLIRRCEARATCRYVGLTDAHAHFLNLPFYETGKIEKDEPTEKDVQIVIDLIREIKPHQIYAAGDLADPHGTHKVCLDVIFEALDQLKEEEFMKDCWVWLYRGAWQEFEPYEIEMAIPMSPDQVIQKRNGILIHQSQKDSVPFQGTDKREFWQRVEDRTAETAHLYDKLGLPEYAALEGFVRYHY